MVVRVQDYEYKRSQRHTLDATDVEALYAGIRANPGICAPLAKFEAANGLLGKDWIRLSIMIHQGAFGRNHPRFGPGCAHRTTDAPVAGKLFESCEARVARLADAVERGDLYDNQFGCDPFLIALTHNAARDLCGSLSLRIASVRRAQEAFEDDWDKRRIEDQLIRPIMRHQVRRLFSRRRSAPVLRFRRVLRGVCYGHGRSPPSCHYPNSASYAQAFLAKQYPGARLRSPLDQVCPPNACIAAAPTTWPSLPGTSPPPSSPTQAFVLAVYGQALSGS